MLRLGNKSFQNLNFFYTVNNMLHSIRIFNVKKNYLQTVTLFKTHNNMTVYGNSLF